MEGLRSGFSRVFIYLHQVPEDSVIALRLTHGGRQGKWSIVEVLVGALIIWSSRPEYGIISRHLELSVMLEFRKCSSSLQGLYGLLS